MEITWYIEDGYCGQKRPHTLEIDDEMLESCGDDDERDALIMELIEDDFHNTCSFYYKKS